ncbi:MAG: phosphatase PAP2 family protein [Candidatus Saccharimonadales bacterium]
MQRTCREWIIDTLVLAITFAVAELYFVFNAPADVINNVKIAFDNSIPRLPVFVVPYLLFLPWLWLIVIYAWLKKKSFYQLALSLTIVNLVAYVVYLSFQTIVPRDPVVGNDIFSSILRLIYENDLPYAAMPSLHSGLSAVAATYFVLRKSKWALAFVSMAALIIVSTLFTKQHFFLDAVTGVGLGFATTLLVFKIVPNETARMVIKDTIV